MDDTNIILNNSWTNGGSINTVEEKYENDYWW